MIKLVAFDTNNGSGFIKMDLGLLFCYFISCLDKDGAKEDVSSHLFEIFQGSFCLLFF